jgi:phenylacetic acid degradation operon negative regulatory protein
MGLPRSRPSDTILDLLRAAGPDGLSARSLVGVAELFGLSENTVRVTLSRLVAREHIASPARGQYCLATQANALNDFVERWRLGELRVRPWRPGEWLFAHPGDDLPGNAWALEALGFREVRQGLHARPDNLSQSLDELRELGAGIGLPVGTLLLAARPQGEASTSQWHRAWHTGTLDDDYAQTTERLRESAARLLDLSAAEARLESFRLGGEAIHKLAKDPLLPAEFVDVGARLELWKAMTDYERLGKSVWSGAFAEPTQSMPIPQLDARAGNGPGIATCAGGPVAGSSPRC